MHASFSLFIHLNYANTRLKLIFQNIDNLVFLSKSENVYMHCLFLYIYIYIYFFC